MRLGLARINRKMDPADCDSQMKTTNEPRLKIEILSTDGGIYNGAVTFNERVAGTIQFNAAACPKRVGSVVRLLRRAGIPVECPRWFR